MRDIVGRRKLWFTIPCVVLVVTLVASLVFGVELDINFRGGSEVIAICWSGLIPSFTDRFAT